ncbi:MAG TPA: GreA/GreB family elongation factor [Acidimicrobiales bacterium]|nr:GreA/GreB family elongation factor [Acidimicrobiales bacterium]
MAETHLSPAALDRLKAELDDLLTRGRAETADLIEKARALGDLSENGDYHAAKNDQGIMEARIRSLQHMIETAVIVEAGTSGVVGPGSVVGIRYDGDDDVERYLIGSIEEKGDLPVMSLGSPLGKALAGCAAGETVEYEVNGTTFKVELVEVGS